MYNYTNKKEEQIDMQRQRVADQKASGIPFQLIGGQQFFASMRDVGYSNEAQAIADIVDNSVEAGATKIEVKTLREGGHEAIKAVAITDNGCGMEPEWLEACLAFGGTTRANKRDGLGRFGMGLSSAGIAFSERLDVYSKTNGGEWRKVFIDLVKGSETEFTDKYLASINYQFNEPTKELPPEWVMSPEEANADQSGTVVVLSSFTPAKRKFSFKAFNNSVSEHLGVTYHAMAGNFEIFVDGELVEFIDPIFTTPGLKYFDLDDDLAENTFENTVSFADKKTGEDFGQLRCRFAVYGPTFGLKPEFKKIKKTKNGPKTSNGRYNVFKKYTGVILVRNGRVIAVDRSTFQFRNNDFSVGVILEFDGAADELFGVTTLKNKMSLKEIAKNALNSMGFSREIAKARSRRNELWDGWSSDTAASLKSAKGTKINPSQHAATVQASTPRGKVDPVTVKKLGEKAEKKTQSRVTAIAEQTGKDEKAVRKEMEAKLVGEPDFIPKELPLQNATFINFEEGMQTELILNTEHPAYKYIYGGPHVSAFGREAVHCMLYAFYHAMITTNIGPSDTGEAVATSGLRDRLISNWSQALEDQLNALTKTTDPDQPENQLASSPGEEVITTAAE